MATFPHSLCGIRFGDHGEQHGSVVARSEFERGLPRQRRTAADSLVAVPCTLLFNSLANAQAWESWFYGEALAGSGLFSFTLPRNGQVVQAQVRGGDIGTLKPRSPDWQWSERTLVLEYVRQGFVTLAPGLHDVAPGRVMQVQRASTAMFVDAAGLLQSAAANVARFSHRIDLANVLRLSAGLESGAVWAKASSGTGVAPVAADAAALGVGGRLTASLVVFDLGGGTTTGDTSILAQNVSAATMVGVSYTSSLWIKAAAPADVGKQVVHRHVAGAGYQVVTLSAQYQLLGTTEVSGGGSFNLGLRGAFGSSTGQVSVHVDELQLERGLARTEYRATGAEPGLSAEPALLVEAGSSNLVLRTAEFENAYWTKVRARIVANALAAPDGTLTADKLVEDTATGDHSMRGTTLVAVAGQKYTHSIFLKAGERSKAQFYTSNPATNFVVDLLTGEITVTAGEPNAMAIPYKNGWWRVAFSQVASATSMVSCYFGMWTTAVSYTGDGVSGLYLWGAQTEAGELTSHVPAGAALAAREADLITVVA